MNAPRLLEIIESRGGVATVKCEVDGIAVLNVSPRSLAHEFLPELRRFKPTLIQLIQSQPPAMSWTSSESPNAPDVRVIAELVLKSRRGQFLSPQSQLVSAWKSLSEFAGCRLTSRHIGMLPTWLQGREHLPVAEFLDLFCAGVAADDGKSAVWRDPRQLADGAHALATARAVGVPP